LGFSKINRCIQAVFILEDLAFPSNWNHVQLVMSSAPPMVFRTSLGLCVDDKSHFGDLIGVGCCSSQDALAAAATFAAFCFLLSAGISLGEAWLGTGSVPSVEVASWLPVSFWFQVTSWPCALLL
jgi:hypothetical protein